MKILIVDSNLVFAKRVRTVLSEYTRNIEVHIATNVPILKRRITEHQYDFIIAEVMAMVEAKKLVAVLEGIVDTPKLLWTVADTDLIKDLKNIVRKPTTEQTLRDTIEHVLPVPA